MTDLDRYSSPLADRYASLQMQEIWSDGRRFRSWRRLWIALAESQMALGLDITPTQIAAMKAVADDLNIDAAKAYEKEFRHDVMAHVHAFGDLAPEARGIIHLGATSQFVNCNTELMQLRDGLDLLAVKTARVVDALGTFAATFRATPTLGYTHYQVAQPTTVGKRATLWAQDMAMSLADLEHRTATLQFRSIRGATGTQASFLQLFGGDAQKVESLDEMVTVKMGWDVDARFAVTGQTYPRLLDAQVLGALAVTAAAIHKCATDLRLLANLGEIEEPFGSSQIGSSAMAYKRNPMRCERACGMARFVMNLAPNALQTASVQWMERTLDDSSNRRLTIPEAFLALDGALDIMHNVTSGLIVHEPRIAARLAEEMPFLATEQILMAAVQEGCDRQEVHEVIRTHALAAAEAVKEGAATNDLLERLGEDPALAGVDLDAAVDARRSVGLATTQVDAFVEDVVDPIRGRYGDQLSPATDLHL
jgi:adenylosuccinate lyase